MTWLGITLHHLRFRSLKKSAVNDSAIGGSVFQHERSVAVEIYAKVLIADLLIVVARK